jgi:CelD/BcsL family acetyltransferase involved in cellulose biosynthesis
VEVELHRGPEEALLADWERLYAGQPGATPFMSPGWARAWFPTFGMDAEPFTVVVRDGGEVAGLAPLVRRRQGPLRVLEPVGMDPGDYWDVLAVPGRGAEVAAAAAQALRAHAGEWDAWILRCPPPESPVPAALDAGSLRSLVRPPIPAPAIELPASFDAYLKGLSSSHRQNLRKHLRRLDNGEIELAEVTDVARLGEVVERWQGFRRAQWAAAGRDINPEHLSPRFAAFMLACLRELLPAGLALVWEFRRAGEVIGTYCNFADDAAFYWYLGGFDPAHTKLGLGKIAIGHGIRTSIEAGRRRYDFGRGAEPYKYWYGAIDRPLAARVVGTARPRSRGALLAARAAIAWRARRHGDDAG